MPSFSNPSEIAREALRLLAVRRLSPSPANYQALYNEIAGIAGEPAETFPEPGLKALLGPLPKETVGQQKLAKRFEQALSGRNWDGGQRPAVRIQANPMALSAYGLSLEDVRTTIAAANVNAAKGSFDGPRLSYIINSNDQLLTAADYQSLIIAYKNNAPIRLADVATISSAAENSYQSAWVNTTPAVIVNIQRQPGANVITVVDRIKQLLPRLQALLPATIQVNTLTDRTITIRASVRDVQFELLLSVSLVVMVIFLFLRNVPATLIPSAAVPLSLVGTLWCDVFVWV